MRRPLTALTVAAVLLLATPAHAENPVLDTDDDADVVAALAEATEAQRVCYGYALTVSDEDTGIYSGTYAASSLGPGVPASTPSPACPEGVVELVARIVYTSSYSESEDAAAWDLVSSVPGLTIRDVEGLGLSASDLVDDSRSGTTLLNAVLSLPRLATEQAGLPPLVLEPNDEPVPAEARPTNTPGSDWLRENGALLAVCALAVAGGLAALVAAVARPGPGRSRRGQVGPGGSGPGRRRSGGPAPARGSPARPRPVPPPATGPSPWSDR